MNSIRSKVLYLLFLWVGGYFSPITKELHPDVNYVIAAVIAVSVFTLCRRTNVPRLNQTYILLFIIGITASMFMAVSLHNQTFLGTAISQRPVYFILCFYLWWKIGLGEEELFRMLRNLSILSVVIFSFSLLNPTLFVEAEKISKFQEMKDLYDNTDILCYIPGFLFVLLYFMYLVQKMIERLESRDLYLSFALLAMFFINQNRSTMIVLAAAYSFFLFHALKKGYKQVYFFAFIFIIAVLPSIMNIVNSLIDETEQQLNDENYNRWVAIRYYIFEFNHGDLLPRLLGNGQPSAGSLFLSQMVVGNSMGAFWSDLGFIGDWFLYGMLPIMSLLMMSYKSIRYRYPIYLKLRFFTYLLVPTISSFGNVYQCSFVISLVIYLFCINEVRLKRLHTKETYKKRW